MAERGQSLRQLFVITGLMAVVGTTGWLARVHVQPNSQSSLAPPLAQLPPELLTPLTLGHMELYHDFLYLWLVQYLAPDASLESAEVLLTRSRYVLRWLPAREGLYLLSCYALAFRHHRPQACRKILLQGMAALPQSWRIPMTLGYAFAFLLGEHDSAAHYYALAAQKPRAPPFLGHLAKKLMAGEGIDHHEREGVFKFMFEWPRAGGL